MWKNSVMHVVLTLHKTGYKSQKEGKCSEITRFIVQEFKVRLWAIFRNSASSYREIFVGSAFIHNLVAFQRQLRLQFH